MLISIVFVVVQTTLLTANTILLRLAIIIFTIESTTPVAPVLGILFTSLLIVSV